MAAAVVLFALPLHGEGFRSPTTGAQGLGTSGGRFAFIDDASAAWHNPANLTLLSKWETSFEPTFVHHQAEFSGPSGTAKTTDPWKFLPALFVGGPLNDRVSAGLAVTVPYGLAVKWDWENAGILKYQAPHFVDLKTFNFNPNLAFKIGDRLRLGVGLDVMWSELQLRQSYSWASRFQAPLLPDGDLRARGDGVGISGNVALGVDLWEGHRAAFTARLPMDVEYEGSFTASNVPGAGTSRTDFNSQINFPTILGFGYGVRLTDTVRVEANMEWIQFSRFETLSLGVDPSTAGFLGLPTEYKQDWRNTFTFGVGGDWAFAEGWKLRLSYQHYQTPVPDRTFSPTIPDSAQNVLTAGVGYRVGPHRLDLSYSRVLYDSRTISAQDNPTFAGTYGIAVHLISAGYGFQF
jgi:long-chain fatty acid transport protein